LTKPFVSGTGERSDGYPLWAVLESRPTKGSEMLYSAAIDGFRLAYERSGSGPSVVLLHGWPGDHTDWDQLIPRLTDVADVLAPDLRGFGRSDKYEADPEEIYSAHGQARAVAALMDELGLKDAVVAGYDVGGAVSQTIAAMRPDPIFPFEWSDQLDAFFKDYTLERLSGSGHFTPLEATDRFAGAIKQRLQNVLGDADRGKSSSRPSVKQRRRLPTGAASST
jgi:pimeloyl-ACP methyl ester carboxylesterase